MTTTIRENDFVHMRRLVAWCLVAATLLLLIGFAGCAGSKSFTRHQKQADAKNRVKVTHIEISRAKQQAQINRAQIEATKAEADKRVAEAQGIRKAQDLIAATLTDRYIQHEAIQAQKTDPGRTVYIPVGPQGIPLVKTTP